MSIMLLLQDVAVKFQNEPLLVPATTVWKTIGGLATSIALIAWRVCRWLWAKHQKDIDLLRSEHNRDTLLIRTDITEMDREIRSQFEEFKDVQDAVIQSTVKIADYQSNRQEIRQSIHDLHLKVDSHHKEQMAVLISILKPERMKS